MEQTGVYAPKSLRLWNTVLNWLTFVVQIVVQIVRSTPSMAQVFSFVGFSDGSFLPSSSTAFKPLPVVEIQVRSSSVGIDGGISSEIDTEAGNFRKLTVVLDLYETLVSAYETSSLPPLLCIKATEAGLKWFELECVSSDKLKECEGKPKINYVTVFERLGLHEFLKELSEFADLILFTAGLEGYARPLVDKIDAGNLFSRHLYRPSTISMEYRDHVKDLSCISQDLCRTIIVEQSIQFLVAATKWDSLCTIFCRTAT